MKMTQIKIVIEESLNNIKTLEETKGLSLERISIAHGNIRQYMTEALALDPERVQAIKDRLQTAIDELKVNVDENRFEQN
jgi:uncharacterized protein YicC (UPF0701 family)